MPKKKKISWQKTQVTVRVLGLLHIFSFLPLFFILFVPRLLSSGCSSIERKKQNKTKQKKKKKRITSLPPPSTTFFNSLHVILINVGWLITRFFGPSSRKKPFSLSHYMYLIWTKLTCLDYYYYYIYIYCRIITYDISHWQRYSVCLLLSLYIVFELSIGPSKSQNTTRKIRDRNRTSCTRAPSFRLLRRVDTSSTKTKQFCVSFSLSYAY